MQTSATSYPSDGLRLFSTLFQLLALVILASCLARISPFDLCALPHISTIESLPTPAVVAHRHNPSQWTLSSSRRSSRTGGAYRSIRRFFESHRILTTGSRVMAWTTVFLSLTFVFVINVLMLGVGLDHLPLPTLGMATPRLCVAVEFLCICFYALIKGFVYLFLIERVHVVLHAGGTTPRLDTMVYRLGLTALALYFVMFGFTVYGRNHRLAPASFSDQLICRLGVENYATIPLVTFDLAITLAFTTLFIRPIISVGKIEADDSVKVSDDSSTSSKAEKIAAGNPRIRVLGEEDDDNGTFLPVWEKTHRLRLQALTRKTLFGTLFALGITLSNMLYLILHNGRLDAWCFITWYTADVTINAMAVFFATGASERSCPSVERRPSVPDVLPATTPRREFDFPPTHSYMANESLYACNPTSLHELGGSKLSLHRPPRLSIQGNQVAPLVQIGSSAHHSRRHTLSTSPTSSSPPLMEPAKSACRTPRRSLVNPHRESIISVVASLKQGKARSHSTSVSTAERDEHLHLRSPGNLRTAHLDLDVSTMRRASSSSSLSSTSTLESGNTLLRSAVDGVVAVAEMGIRMPSISIQAEHDYTLPPSASAIELNRASSSSMPRSPSVPISISKPTTPASERRRRQTSHAESNDRPSAGSLSLSL